MALMARVIAILEQIEGISDWKINEFKKYSEEVFFIKKTLDMNRSKDVHVCEVTVYVSFTEEEIKYLGQSTTEIADTMSDEAIRLILEDTRLAASFVKNKYYELPKPTDEIPESSESNFAEDSLISYIPKMIQSIYVGDTFEAGGINSLEVFLNRTDKRLKNSQGIDVGFTSYDSLVEVITEWNDGKEPVESFSIMKFGDYMPKVLEDNVGQLIQDSKDRAHALEAMSLKDVKVILGGEAVSDFFGYYLTKTNARAIYEKLSSYEIGNQLQGDSVTGDLVTMELLPYLKGSSQSAPYDQDGILLKSLSLIEEGVVKAFHGENQYTAYLDLPTTGRLTNMNVAPGRHSIDHYKKEPYVELLAFSAFQMSPISGDFGGEVRLAKYFDGEKVTILSGGAISANIKKVQASMCFSKELATIDHYRGPKYIIFDHVEFSGK